MHHEMAAPGTRLIREDRHPRPWSNENNVARGVRPHQVSEQAWRENKKTMQKMKAIKLRVIYFTRDPSPALLASFEERDWEVDVIGSVRDVRQAVDDGSQAAGLADLASVFDPGDIAALEACLAMPNIGWVAMTAAPELDDAAIRRLVRDYCFDYVTLPTANARVIDTVGHACGMISLGEPVFVDTSTASRARQGHRTARAVHAGSLQERCEPPAIWFFSGRDRGDASV